MKYLTISLILLFSLNLYGQKKKQIRNDGFTSLTVTEIKFKSGNELKSVKSKHKFNKIGEETETILYDEKGKQKERKVCEYNLETKKVKEIDFNSENKLSSIKEIKYNEQNLKSEEIIKNSAGKIIKIIKYLYNGQLVNEKLVYDGSKKLISKTIYSFE